MPSTARGAPRPPARPGSTSFMAARQTHSRHATLLVSETRDHGSETKPAKVIAELGRTNTVVDSVAFSPGKTEILNDLHYGGGTGPIGLLVMAVKAPKKNPPPARRPVPPREPYTLPPTHP